MAKDAAATIPARDTQQPQTEDETQAMYEWKGDEPNCPDDLVVNAGNQTLVVAAPQQIPYDNPRVDPGDRRRGDYYVRLAKNPDFNGLQRVKDLPQDRLAELSMQRKLRTGEEPPEWAKEAWAKLKPEDKKEG